MSLQYQRLRQAALDVIDALRHIPQFSDLRIAVIGGFARVHHNPGGRGTSDVDFIIDTAEIALERQIKQAILSLPNTNFSQEAHKFQHVLNGGADYCRVDFFARDIGPYLPPAAQQVQLIPLTGLHDIPFISPTDLFVFKVHSCGTRGDEKKNSNDALDAEDLLASNVVATPLVLTPEQQLVVTAGIGNVLDRSQRSRLWWRQHGL